MNQALDDARKATMIANLPWEKKKTKHKEKRLKFKLRISNPFWKSERTKVCEERLKHYEQTGNENKASIYRSKLS